MNTIELLTGSRFQSLIHEGKKINHLIKKGSEVLLKQSSPEKENAINSMWYRLSLPNPFSIGFIILLLLISLVWGWSTLIYYFDISIPARAILSLSIAPLSGMYIVFILYGLRCGYASGLLLIRHFFILNISLTLIALSLLIIQSTQNNEWMKQLNVFPLQLITLYLCRHIMNSDSFYKLTSFFYTLRLTLEAKKIREKQKKHFR